MKSSGRLPSADWTTPAAEEPSAAPELFRRAADDMREERDRQAAASERKHGCRIREVRHGRSDDEQRGEPESQEVAPAHPHIIDA